jgi:hypothetical protein
MIKPEEALDFSRASSVGGNAVRRLTQTEYRRGSEAIIAGAVESPLAGDIGQVAVDGGRTRAGEHALLVPQSV